MMRPMRRSSVAALLAAALLFGGVWGTASPAAAGPWAPDQGSGYVKLWLKYLWGFWFNDPNGDIIDYGTYHEAHLSAYAEVGLFDRFGLILHAPLVRTFHLEDPRDGSYTSHMSPGDPTVSLRWQLLSIGRLAGSVEAGVRMPFARPGPVQPVYSRDEGNPQVGELQIGTGVWDFPLVASVGYGFDGFYLAGSGGYLLRTSGYDHQILWSAEGGWNIDSQWAARVRVTGVHSIDVWFEDEAPGHLSPSGVGNGTDYIGAAFEVDFQFQPQWYVGATVEGGLGYLRRQTGGPVISVYLANRFGPAQ